MKYKMDESKKHEKTEKVKGKQEMLLEYGKRALGMIKKTAKKNKKK